MKKVKKVLGLLLTVVVFVGLFHGKTSAQDLIITSDSQKIEAVIIEVSDDAVRYKKFSNQSGPAFVIKSEKISTIIYQNGEVQVFTPKQQDANQQSEKQENKNCFEFTNAGSKVQNAIVVHNGTSEELKFKIYGTELRSGAKHLLSQDIIPSFSSKTAETVSDGGRLDHYSSFSFCPDGDFSSIVSGSVCGDTESLDIFVSGDQEKMNVTFKIEKKEMMIELWVNKANFYFYDSELRVVSALNYDINAKKKKYYGDSPNFHLRKDTPNYIVADDAEETQHFLNYLMKAEGDAVIEYHTKRTPKNEEQSILNSLFLTRNNIENLLETYKSGNSQTKKLKH